VPPWVFAINGTTCQLSLNQTLDFDTAPELGGGRGYSLKIRASDGSLTNPQQSPEYTVPVFVLLQNEPPTLTTPARSVRENATAGALVGARLNATDDASHWSAITYALVGGSAGFERFSVVGNGQIRLVAAGTLDHETEPSVRLLVRLWDNEAGRNRSRDANVTITVEDGNDAPFFALASNSRNVSEHAAVGTPLLPAIAAQDQDASDALSFAIVGGNANGWFRVAGAGRDATVETNATLNYLAFLALTGGAPLELRLNVSDGLAASTTTVRINITNAPDAPRVLNANFTLAENMPAGALVGRVRVADPDPGHNDTVVFQIVGGTGLGLFAFAGHNVTTGAPLDFERAPLVGNTPAYTLVVNATDPDGLWGTGTVVVFVLDAPDAPYAYPALMTLPENTPRNRFVGAVVAWDEDAGQNATLRFAITGGTGAPHFWIAPHNGSVFTSALAADFESTPLVGGVRTQQLLVTVNDTTGLNVTVPVNVTVTDEPDAPRILPGEFSVSEAAPLFSIVGTLPAWDEDAGQNATLSFALTGGSGAALFGLHAGNGTLFLVQALDFETAPLVDGRRLYTVEVGV
jgi:cadherin 23